MKDFTLLTPPKIVFGSGVFKQHGAEAAGWGERVLLVTGSSSMARSGILERTIVNMENNL